jgi:phosphotriesterase-related protein
MIKVGASPHSLTAVEETAFTAAAAAHASVGAPVCVHTEHGTHGLEVVERLTGLGVPAGRLVVAHLDRNPDPGLHAEIAATGAYLEYDGPGRAKYHPDSTILATIAAMVERGHGGQLLVGGDTSRRSALRVTGGGPGLAYAAGPFRARLRRELGEEVATRIYVTNPAQAFAFLPRS